MRRSEAPDDPQASNTGRGARAAGLLCLLALPVLAFPVLAFQVRAARANTPGECIALWDGLSRSNQTRGIAQQDFMAACLAHKVTAAPPAMATPLGATGRCRDGLYTTASVPLAGCDHHGGLAALLRP